MSAMADDEACDIHVVFDFALAYFVWCHSLREWVINDGAMPKDKLDVELQQYDVWPVVRDIANRSRHLDLKFNPKDKDWSMKREFDMFGEMTGRTRRHILNLWSGQDHYKVDELVNRSFDMWSSILPNQ